MQSMFRLVDLCYGISLVFIYDCSSLACHSDGVGYLKGLEYMFINASMVFGLLDIIRCVAISTEDVGRLVGGDSPIDVAMPQRTGGRKSLKCYNGLADQPGVVSR